MATSNFTRATTQPPEGRYEPISTPGFNSLPSAPDPQSPFLYSQTQLAVAPPQLSTAPDQLGNWRRRGISQTRIFALPVATSTSTGAVAASQSQTTIESISSSVTNNILGSAFYQTVEQAGVAQPQEKVLNFLSPIITTDNSGNSSTDIEVPVFGPSGAGHKPGLVTDPGAGAGTTHFLCEDGSWQIPPGTGGAANYQTVQSAGVSAPVEPILNFLSPFVVTDNPGNTSTDISISVPVIQLLTTTLMSGNLNISANTLTNISDLNQSLTMPATGGPFRVEFTYTINWTNTANGPNPVDTYVTDGTNTFPAFETSPSSGGTNFFSNTQTFTTTVTYANGAIVPFRVYIIGGSTMTFRVLKLTDVLSGLGVPGTYLQTKIVTSN